MNPTVESGERPAFGRTTGILQFSRNVCLASLFLSAGSIGPAVAADKPSSFDTFVGSSPSGESISQFLPISADSEMPIKWQLTLYRDPKNGTPLNYKLRCDYAGGNSQATAKSGKHGRVEKDGAWKLAKGTKSNPEAVVYELAGLMSLLKVDENILQMMNPDRSLMVGNGGWSFTLNRASAAEAPGPMVPANAPSVSYTNSPLASGPDVFGVFEGRSPCIGIARELQHELDFHRLKAKWRVTLYQNPETKSPAAYKVEGSLYRGNMRTGNWSIIRGTASDPAATVYRLEPAKGEEALFLLHGDDNVLFFLDHNRKPLVGHADFSYTLNRRTVVVASLSSNNPPPR